MSLRAFHIVFIVASILLAFMVGVWALRDAALHDGEHRLLGIVSLLFGVALLGYGAWFIQKVRQPDVERRKRRKPTRTVTTLMLVSAMSATDSLACSVCYGEAEGPMIDAARLGVYLLFGLVLLMQVSFAAFFIVLWRRGKGNPSLDAPTPRRRDRGVA
jgi:hypothetical protein